MTEKEFSSAAVKLFIKELFSILKRSGFTEYSEVTHANRFCTGGWDNISLEQEFVLKKANGRKLYIFYNNQTASPNGNIWFAFDLEDVEKITFLEEKQSVQMTESLNQISMYHLFPTIKIMIQECLKFIDQKNIDKDDIDYLYGLLEERFLTDEEIEALEIENSMMDYEYMKRGD